MSSERHAFEARRGSLAGARAARMTVGATSAPARHGRDGARGYPSRPCACPTCSSPRSATTRPTPRCRRTACSCGPGYVRQLGSGIYSLLPLGLRVSDRVEQIIREEQDAIGGQEMEMPVVHPADIWRASGRYDAIGPELARFKDRAGRDMVLAMTHEEVVADPARATSSSSYRQLPMQVYHFQTKFRDEPRSRGGLIRVREFVMKDAY